MAWSIVGIGATNETTTTSLSLAEPAGVADGDLLIACIASRTTATTAITNTGWLEVGSQNNSNTSTNTSAMASATMLYQIRKGAPDLTFVVPAGISVATGRIVAYRGASPTPLDIQSVATTGTNTTAVSLPGTTLTQAGDLLVAMMAGGQEATWSGFNNATSPPTASGATDTTTAPSTTAWIERVDQNTVSGADTSLGIFDHVRTASGSTGNFSVTASLAAAHAQVVGAFFPDTLTGTADAWNKLDRNTSATTLSNSDKTVTITGSTNVGIRSTRTNLNGTAGKYYAEVLISTLTGTATQIGFSSMTTSVTDFLTTFQVQPGLAASQVAVNNVVVGNIDGVAFVNGNVLCMAWDAGTEKVWFRKNGGNWNNSGTANPATGVGGFDVSYAPATAHAIFVNNTVNGCVFVLRTRLADFTLAIPSGFSSWMGETPIANAWSNVDKSVNITLSNSDKTATIAAGGTNVAVRSTTSITAAAAGLNYAEIKLNALPITLGLKSKAATLTDILTSFNIASTSGSCSNSTTTLATLGAFAVNDVICLAWKGTGKLLWVRKNGGLWNNDAAADPATGTNGMSTGILGTDAALWVLGNTLNSSVTIRTEVAEFTQAVPAGFKSWMAEPLLDAWNANDRYVGALSNSDKTFTQSGGGQIRSTKTYAQSAGDKLYCEVVWGSSAVSDGNTRVGIHDTDSVITSYLFNSGSAAHFGIGINGISLGTGNASTLPILSANAIVSLAIDAANLRGWVRVGNGLWNNNASADPATNVGGLNLASYAGQSFSGQTFAIGATLITASDQVTIRTRTAEFTQITPSGFLSWMGEALFVDPNVTVSLTGMGLTASTVSLVEAGGPLQLNAWNWKRESPLDAVFTNLDKTVTAQAGRSALVYSTTERTTGKYYVEVKVTTTTSGVVIGLWHEASQTGTVLTSAGTAQVWIDGVNTASRALFSALAVNDVVGMAVNLVTGKIWFRVNGGYWNNSPGQSPEAG